HGLLDALPRLDAPAGLDVALAMTFPDHHDARALEHHGPRRASQLRRKVEVADEDAIAKPRRWPNDFAVVDRRTRFELFRESPRQFVEVHDAQSRRSPRGKSGPRQADGARSRRPRRRCWPGYPKAGLARSPACGPAFPGPSGVSEDYAAAQRRGSRATGSSMAISSQSRSGGGLEAAAITAASSAAVEAPTITASASGRDSAKPSAACSGSERPSAIMRRARDSRPAAPFSCAGTRSGGRNKRPFRKIERRCTSI